MLTTIERELLGLHRRDGVPGAELLGRYREWLRSGDPSSIAGVLEHNRLDVLSMVSLLDELTLRVSEPASLLQRDPVGARRLAQAARDSGRRRRVRAHRSRSATARKTVGENNKPRWPRSGTCTTSSCAPKIRGTTSGSEPATMEVNRTRAASSRVASRRASRAESGRRSRPTRVGTQ
ncbi:MAG: hypothetical protein EXR76_04510 [Myxococcales bacterium]|nr:hypothetical protein [Myxococcales bacterium]